MTEEKRLEGFRHFLAIHQKIPNVRLLEEDRDWAFDHAKDKAEYKKNSTNLGDMHYISDPGSLFKRALTGNITEIAVTQYLGVDKKLVIDERLGDSRDFNHADLSRLGLNLGVKGSSWGLCPLVNVAAPENQDQLITVRNLDSTNVWICGVATKELIIKYSSQDYVKDSRVAARNTKKGFYGFEYLEPFDDYLIRVEYDPKTITALT